MSTSENMTLAVAIVGAATGLLGAVLGIVNTWHQMSREKVRLKVTPEMAYRDGRGRVIISEKPIDEFADPAASGIPAELCIEVINLSAFDITIVEIGFGRPGKGRLRVLVMKSVRLAPRESHREFAPPNERLIPEYIREPVAYAKTACGGVFIGTSPILKQHLECVQQGASNG